MLLELRQVVVPHVVAVQVGEDRHDHAQPLQDKAGQGTSVAGSSRGHACYVPPPPSCSTPASSLSRAQLLVGPRRTLR